jgi:hypothetical protein
VCWGYFTPPLSTHVVWQQVNMHSVESLHLSSQPVVKLVSPSFARASDGLTQLNPNSADIRTSCEIFLMIPLLSLPVESVAQRERKDATRRLLPSQ